MSCSPDPIRSSDARPQLVLVLPRQVGAAGQARRAVAELLGEPVTATVRYDVQLIVSELVTNALRHGEGPTVLRAALTATVVQLSVTDSGDGVPRMLPPEPGRVGGLGLVVVDRLTTEWGVASFPGGKTVWALLARPSP
jgi:anti-sigma regulatory factor (Ser/Thr protein kinase)